ncbi:MAG: chorismate synthase, partial [Deltaproteobacteria bacterium]|nr:chorismate synthase [Deltaproteobacteria bacterium]
MAGNTFGKVFRVTTWGESHGRALGVVIDGCPPLIPLSEADIQVDLEQRRPGKAGVVAATRRKEPDVVEILSGVFAGKTTGTPISLIIFNRDVDTSAYEPIKDLFRPGHGDYTYLKKYGIRDNRGGGRASGRETVGRVAAGAVARKLLEREGMRVIAYTLELGGVRAGKIDLAAADENFLFCPDPEAALRMEERIKEVRAQGDSLGGIVEIVAKGCPVGLGEPVFDKLDGDLARAMMSIGAVKGVEIGSGFEAARRPGSQNNDPILPHGFATNNAGGILAGISNGDDIVVRVAVKPIPSIARPQQTVNINMEPREITVGGRHDVSAIPRIVPVCAAMMRLTLADHLLRQRAIKFHG